MKSSSPCPIPDGLSCLCARLTDFVMQQTRLSPCHAEDIRQKLFLDLLICSRTYRPGKRSLAAFLRKRGHQMSLNLIRKYRSNKRVELCHRISHPFFQGKRKEEKQGENRHAEEYPPMATDTLSTRESRIELCVDIRARVNKLSRQELSLLLELLDGITPSESRLGLTPAKRRRLRAVLKKKFADLQFYLTR